MSLEGEFITEHDLSKFVAKHSLPFPDELLASMFAEANSTENGLVDAEQLGKAVSYKFPYRQHNDDWVRLFELAPRPSGSRITSLSPRAHEQEPIRANFEQEPNIMTFWPVTNAGSSPRGSPAHMMESSRSMMQSGGSFLPLPTGGGLSQTSFSTAPRTMSSSAVFNTAHSLPTRVGTEPDTFAEREEEDKINRRMRPASWWQGGGGGGGGSGGGGAAAYAGAPSGARAGTQTFGGPSSSFDNGATQVASFEKPEAAPMHCGFDACAAFDRSLEELTRVSEGVGWKTAGAAAARAAHNAGPPPPLLHGLHERDWLYLPGNTADHIPMRVDGLVGRVTGVPATTPLRLLVCENSLHGLENSKKHAQAEDPARFTNEPFVTRFAKPSNLQLKKTSAEQRLEVADGTEYPPAIAYLNGKPSAYEFRPPKPDPSKQPLGEQTPKFLTDTLGRHWPVREGKPCSALLQANPPLSCPPLRLALTENEQPAARSTRVDIRH